MITVRVNLTARLGKQQELVQSIRRLKNKIAEERGCIACRVYQNLDNPDEFVVFEQWKNEKQAKAHLDSENMAVLVGAGSVLSRDISVSLTKESSTADIEQNFKERMVREEK